MAAKESNGTGGGPWVDDATWTTTRPIAGDTVTVKATDTVTVTGAEACDAITDVELGGLIEIVLSETLTVGGDVAVTGQIQGEGSIIIGGSASGNIFTEGGLTFTGAAGGALTWDGAAFTNVPVTINNAAAGSFTLSATATTGDFILTAGKFTDGGNAVNVNGDLIRNGGTLTSTGTWTQTADGNVAWDDFASTFNKLVLGSAGVTSTLTATVRCSTFEHGSGTVDLAGRILLIHPEGNNFWIAGTGPITTSGGSVIVSAITGGAFTNADKITLGAPIKFVTPKTKSYSLTLGLDCGANMLTASSNAAAGFSTLFLPGGLKCGPIVLSDAATTEAKIVFGGTCVFVSLTEGHPDNDDNGVDFADAYVEASGDIDLEGFASVDNTSCHIVNPGGGAGDIAFVPAAVSPAIQCHGITDGGNNDGGSVKFDEHAHPGTLALLDVGV